MKLRTTHNSIRIRIRKSELASLKKQGRVEEQIQFPGGGRFSFVLCIADEVAELNAQLQTQCIEVQLPTAAAQQWIDTNQVGLSHQHPLPNGEVLHLLVEKDFPCPDRPGENKADTFEELAADKPDAC